MTDVNDKAHLINNGWVEHKKSNDFAAFRKGVFYVWDNGRNWTFAELTGGNTFVNHTKFADLESVSKFSIA
jgi:hypothetical protein